MIKSGKTYHLQSAHSRWSGYEGISGKAWCTIRVGANSRSLPLSISIVDAWAIYKSQNNTCAYTGLEIGFVPEKTASLDRIDSSVGYESKNVQWVHKKINRMKWSLSENDFLRYCYLTCFTPVSENHIEIERKRDPKWSGCGNIPNWYVGRLKNIANRRKKRKSALVFDNDVDAEYLWDLYVKQNGLCAFTSLPIYFPRHAYVRLQATASLDRIDSRVGYVRGNLQWVHKDVNNMKGTLSDDEFRDLCFKVVQYSPTLKRLAEM